MGLLGIYFQCMFTVEDYSFTVEKHTLAPYCNALPFLLVYECHRNTTTEKESQMKFTNKDLDLIRIAVQLRREAAMENEDLVDQHKWESILIKIGIMQNLQNA